MQVVTCIKYVLRFNFPIIFFLVYSEPPMGQENGHRSICRPVVSSLTGTDKVKNDSEESQVFSPQILGVLAVWSAIQCPIIVEIPQYEPRINKL